MPTKRLSMRKLREILRLRLHAKLKMRPIKNSVNVSLGAIQKISRRASELSLSWSEIEKLDDRALSSLFYPDKTGDQKPPSLFQRPDWAEVHGELRRKGVTKYLLWEEYTQEYPGKTYGYSQYCSLYRTWLAKQKRSMRQSHKASEKLFVDYAGQTMPVICTKTGETRVAQIFVAVLGASNYTFAEATWSQNLSDWTGSHVRALDYIGGVPEIIIPDNLRSGVTNACRYDPGITPAYQQWASHYGTVIIPARPRKPQDKAKAEVGVQIIERWILARLRHHRFFSLAELNQAIEGLLKEVNNKPFKQMKGSRQEWFEQLDKPHLSPLPKHPYCLTDIKEMKVRIDYHLPYEEHFYSVPHHLVGEQVELHVQDKMVLVYFRNKCIARHVRHYHAGTTTTPQHMPQGHRQHHKWTPERLMSWAKSSGEETQAWVKSLFDEKDHDEQVYRMCLGLLNLSRNYSDDRLNKACAVANQHHLYGLRNIKEILTNNQDKHLTEQEDERPLLPQYHENIRGPQSFH